MSIGYTVAYAVGVTPWERAGEHGTAALEKIIAQVEDDLGRPGSALDLGCGSGLHVITLARRGWRVTGVDAVGKAVRRARKRVAQAGVEANVVRGDVTDLDPGQVGSGHQLFLDIGCFHGLSDEQRVRMGRTVTEVAAPEAMAIILAFRPGSRPPLPRGADGSAIEAAFPEWQIVDVEPAPVEGMPKPLRKTAPAFYILRRRS